MKRWMIGLLMTALVLSYQNCGSPQGPMGAGGENTLIGAIDSGEQVEPETWTGVEFVTGSEDSFRGEKFHLDLDTGVVTPQAVAEVRAKLDSSAKFCLSDDELEEVRAIIETSSVCEPMQEKAEANQVCTMVYKQPYAWLVSEDSRGEVELALGESVNGCQKPTDLCGDHADLLKGFIASVAKTLYSKTCE